MARPLRIEYPGALYHVTSRGNAGSRIFKKDTDRQSFLDLLGFVIERFNWLCHAYCLMDNHYHILIETPEGNLSRGMRQLNGIYTQKYNTKYHITGHLFQGRYKAIIVDKDSYLLELCRYIILNPVRAGMVYDPKEWKWSSYSQMFDPHPPIWLTTDWILGQFHTTRKKAIQAYRQFILEGITEETPWKRLKGQIFLGDQPFIKNVKKRIAGDLKEISRSQRYAGRPDLDRLFSRKDRNRAVYLAHTQYGYSLKQIGDHLGLHYTTISKIVKGETT